MRIVARLLTVLLSCPLVLGLYPASAAGMASTTLLHLDEKVECRIGFEVAHTEQGRGSTSKCLSLLQLASRSMAERGHLQADLMVPRGTRLADDALELPVSESWGNSRTLARHFRDHGADFGAASADDYARQASTFLQRAQRQGLPTKIDADGVIRVYDPATNTFGAYNPSGTTRTFFKPTSPTYFERQPGVPPWQP